MTSDYILLFLLCSCIHLPQKYQLCQKRFACISNDSSCNGSKSDLLTLGQTDIIQENYCLAQNLKTRHYSGLDFKSVYQHSTTAIQARCAGTCLNTGQHKGWQNVASAKISCSRNRCCMVISQLYALHMPLLLTTLLRESISFPGVRQCIQTSLVPIRP